jgi:transaldolase/glucose-6-phosphate isomerase
MSENPLLKLPEFGQSIWLDFLRRRLYTSGELQRLIEEDGLRGMTSNPAIFEKAIAGSHDYDEAIQVLALEELNAQEAYERLVVEDVQHAADVFRPIYDESEGRDGFVSLEVSPHLAHDTRGTVAEARRLWAAVGRPNVMIKVPATLEGLPAIEQLIGEGINVNVTLLFGLPRYRQVIHAYVAGLEARAAQNQPVERIASVASFFLSRIDVLVDPMIEDRMEQGDPKAELANKTHGQVAVASAKVAYQIYKEAVAQERFHKLAALGARTQRLLWASTSTKNPAYSDVKYVEALIGPETVNTVPLETLNAYRDHGDPEARLERGVAEARSVLENLKELEIDLDAETQELEDEGVVKFVKPFNQLMDTLEKEVQAAVQEPIDGQILELAEYHADVRQRLDELDESGFAERLWRKDPSLWKKELSQQAVITNAMGWLHVAEKMVDATAALGGLLAEVREAGFRHVVHMGMGGSSLAPLTFQRTFSPGADGLSLTVLDTTDPTTILKVQCGLELDKTLFIVASKSGTTTETRTFGGYFYDKVKKLKGEQAGKHFVAITDPGTPLADLARKQGFRRLLLNFTDIGGRYSALSYFGLTPAALMGVDVDELLLRALRAEYACSPHVQATDNPGLILGAVLGELARHGRDKVTFVVPEAIVTLGMWLEQLLAESTGKEGTGLLPVASEPLGVPSVYGSDRLFVYLRLRDDVDQALERGVAALRDAGHPIVTIQLGDRLDLGQEFFRWEIATATAGALLGINAFNQPNVQESKDNTKRLLEIFEKENRLPDEKPTLQEEPLSIYYEKVASDAAQTLARFFDQARPGDYVALMAYITEDAANDEILQEIRVALRDSLHLATTVGYGPRFLHSTGQLHKGGPNTGLFLQLTVDETEDATIPGKPYTFGMLKRAQAQGDLEALRKHGRRVMRIHLGDDALQGLAAVEKVLKRAIVG